MHMSTLFVALLTAIVIWAVIARRLTAKPWKAVRAHEIDGIRDIHPLSRPAAKVGMAVFLACITSLFALFVTAYSMRMDPNHASDWLSIAKPGILWLNTFLLVLSSAAMQWARVAERRGELGAIRYGLSLGGVFALAFLVGQWLAWRELKDSSLFDIRNPAVGFFYLLTGVHGLHLLGGLAVWCRTTYRSFRAESPEKGNLTLGLCTTYWHYLLLVWLFLFYLLSTT